jgi:hypothetical protein
MTELHPAKVPAKLVPVFNGAERPQPWLGVNGRTGR